MTIGTFTRVRRPTLREHQPAARGRSGMLPALGSGKKGWLVALAASFNTPGSAIDWLNGKKKLLYARKTRNAIFCLPITAPALSVTAVAFVAHNLRDYHHHRYADRFGIFSCD